MKLDGETEMGTFEDIVKQPWAPYAAMAIVVIIVIVVKIIIGMTKRK